MVNPAGAAAILEDLDCDIDRAYMRFNNLQYSSNITGLSLYIVSRLFSCLGSK